MVDRLLFDGTVVLYVLGTGGFLAFLLLDRPKVARAARAITMAGFAVHSASLVARYVGDRVSPTASLLEALSFFAWAIVGASIVFQSRYRMPVLGAFATPLAAMLLLVASTSGGAAPPPSSVPGVWLPIHVGLVFLGDALLALAACAGLMYILQERTLKAKRGGWVTRRFPSLEVLDAVNVRSLTIGFLLLTLGLLSGGVIARFASGAITWWEPTVVFSILTWVLYAVLLHGRVTVGWRGHRAAVLAIAGFVAVLVTLVGVGLFRVGGHTV
ncbi:MAG TPA: cytochrome c biogenesis protein CcsA [Thermodesulfobacteriota bacterium]